MLRRGPAVDQLALRKHIIEAFIMGFVGDLRDLLGGIGDAHRPNVFLLAQGRQGAIVKARAIADPVPGAIERGQGHEQEIRRRLGRSGQRLFDRHLSRNSRLAWAPHSKYKGGAERPVTGSAVLTPASPRFSRSGRVEGSVLSGK